MESAMRIAERYVAPLGRSPLVPSAYSQFAVRLAAFSSSSVGFRTPHSEIRIPLGPKVAFYGLNLIFSP